MLPVKRMGITETLRRIWLFSANKIKSSEYFSKQPTELIIAEHNCHTNSVAAAVTVVWPSCLAKIYSGGPVSPYVPSGLFFDDSSHGII